MKERTASRLAWTMGGLFVPLAVATKYLESRSGELLGSTVESVSLLAAFAVFTAVGALIAGRRPRNAIGWMLLAVALGAVFTAFAGTYTTYGLVERPGSLPGAGVMAWFESWTWYPSIGLMMTFLILLFPTGRLPSPRWRLLAWADAVFILALVLPAALAPEIEVHGDTESESVVLRNPLGIGVARGVLETVESATGIVGLMLFGLGVVSVFFRYRNAGPDERQQLKWFMFATAVGVGGMAVGELAPDWAGGNVVFAVLVSLIPVSIAIAILKHRLYDIDVVINKTIVYGALAGFITLVYVGIVVGLGNLISTRGEPNLGLQIAATALVAVAFQPVRARVQRLANRLLYGERATPYEVLARFSEGFSGSYATEEALPRMARVAADGTGASSVAVWLRLGETLRPAAAWPAESQARMGIPLDDGEVPPLPGADRTYSVRHRGELLGALTVVKRPGDPLRPQEDALLRDLAAQAGLVLRNVRLTADLRARLDEITRQADELRESRRRVVAAQDGERRRLERNIHDGAQQYLVALAVRLRLAENLAGKDPAKARPLLEQLVGETEGSLESLQELARGLYPPVLEREGIGAALRAQASRSAVPVEVAGEIGRYGTDIEAAVYFACLEALQNVAKYADASRATVRLLEENGELRFSVSDDGRGFDPDRTPRGSGLENMGDRLAAVGGTVEVRSARGRGTTVTGKAPASRREAVA